MPGYSVTILKVVCLILSVSLAFQGYGLLTDADGVDEMIALGIDGLEDPEDVPADPQEKTVDGPPAPSEQSSVVEKKPAAPPEEPPAAEKKPAAPPEEPSTAEKKPPTSPGQPPAAAKKPPAAASVPPLPEAYKAIDGSGIFGRAQKKQGALLLLGIAGDYVFLQTPAGKQGAARIGEPFGGVKVLKMDVNRVLVEFQSKKQELTIFGGVGSSSLLPKSEVKK